MKQLNYTIIKLTVFLILGIVFAYFVKVSIWASALLSGTLLLCCIILFLVTKKQFNPLTIFGILVFATTFSIGILVVNLHEQSNWDSHYTKTKSFQETPYESVSFRITEILKPSKYQDKYVAELLTFNQNHVSGKLLINIDIDSLQNTLTVDDIVFAKAELTPINKPLNPHQFDYSAYLKKKYILHQIYTTSDKLLVKSDSYSSILGFAKDLRSKINTKLNEHAFSNDELAIINAILLGQRRDLSKAMYESYASAGAIHILAVSGLHVGIILMILQFLLKPLERFKNGRLVKIILIVTLLWLFAIIAGLSASVVRAVTMFCIVAIGMNLKRPTNIYNTLAISMFILLLFKPLFIFDVGFQLSYLAVFAIVWIQPMLYKLWSPKFKTVDYFWQIFTVTIAAQIGVAPLSLFYFHQFPGLFFVSNLIIIPVLGLILGFGILIIFLALLNALPSFIANIYSSIISTLNMFVNWVAEQEAFLFKGISFGIVSVVLSYLLIISTIRLLKQRSYGKLIYVLALIIAIQSYAIYNKSKVSESFVVFNKSRKSMIAFQEQGQLKVFHNLDKNDLKYDNALNSYVIGENIDQVETGPLKSVYSIKNKLLLIIDSLPAYNTSFKPDLILLRNSPKINLERLIEQHNPELIIADGSNYKSYVKQWETTCTNKKLPFHATSKKGALTIEYTK